MNDLTHLDLFSGIGGFALAARAAGFRTVGFSEIEPFACEILKRRFPGVPNLGDVRNRSSFTGARGCTVITGGFPCQPWSVAGQRRGEGDDRHLWPAMCALIAELGASWVIGENVLGIADLGLDQVLSDLEAMGYAAQPLVVPACALGAWHVRDRVWILAHAERVGSAERVAGPRRACQGLPGVANYGLAAVDGATVRRALDRWAAEPSVGRMVHGLPDRAHRLRGLGNAIVPDIPEIFLRFIAQIERGEIAA